MTNMNIHPLPTEDDARRTVSAIAADILRLWKKPNYATVPYLRAMLSMDTGMDIYGCDHGSDVIGRFLANAGTFKGEKARVLKAELAEHLPEPQRTAARKRYAPKPARKTSRR
jgi:hypothetical protein